MWGAGSGTGGPGSGGGTARKGTLTRGRPRERRKEDVVWRRPVKDAGDGRSLVSRSRRRLGLLTLDFFRWTSAGLSHTALLLRHSFLPRSSFLRPYALLPSDSASPSAPRAPWPTTGLSAPPRPSALQSRIPRRPMQTTRPPPRAASPTPSPPRSCPRQMRRPSSATSASAQRRRPRSAAKTSTACSATTTSTAAGRRPSRSSSSARARAARAPPSSVSPSSLPSSSYPAPSPLLFPASTQASEGRGQAGPSSAGFIRDRGPAEDRVERV